MGNLLIFLKPIFSLLWYVSLFLSHLLYGLLSLFSHHKWHIIKTSSSSFIVIKQKNKSILEEAKICDNLKSKVIVLKAFKKQYILQVLPTTHANRHTSIVCSLFNLVCQHDFQLPRCEKSQMKGLSFEIKKTNRLNSKAKNELQESFIKYSLIQRH